MYIYISLYIYRYIYIYKHKLNLDDAKLMHTFRPSLTACGDYHHNYYQHSDHTCFFRLHSASLMPEVNIRIVDMAG